MKSEFHSTTELRTLAEKAEGLRDPTLAEKSGGLRSPTLAEKAEGPRGPPWSQKTLLGSWNAPPGHGTPHLDTENREGLGGGQNLKCLIFEVWNFLKI